LPLIVVP